MERRLRGAKSSVMLTALKLQSLPQVSSITREGKRQRFCQQCGRFHDLTSFDGDKRSCRARLQRHNARRRKKTADGDSLSCIKVPLVKRQSSLGRGSREFMRSDSAKKQQTSDSTSVSTSTMASIATVHVQPLSCSLFDWPIQ
jgi:hypothetical protein